VKNLSKNIRKRKPLLKNVLLSIRELKNVLGVQENIQCAINLVANLLQATLEEKKSKKHFECYYGYVKVS
jgi:hypothetical protein